MNALTSPSTSAGIPVSKSPPKERPKKASLFPGAAVSERDGGHTSKTTGSQLSLEWLSQFPSAQTAVPLPPTRPSASTSGEHNVRVEDAVVAADEREQLMELLGLIGRLKNLLTPATERLLRLRGTLKALKEQVAVSAAPGNTPAGLSISSVSMADTLPSVRLCVAGTSDEAMEEVFQFIVHRDPPGHRCCTGNAASGGCSPALHSASCSGARLPTPDIGQSTFSQVSPCSNGGRRRSRFDSAGVSAGTNGVAQTGHPGGSASSAWQSGAVAFGEEGKTVSAGGSSLRFPSTPPLAPSLISASQAAVHDTQSPSGARQPGSPGVTEMPSLDQFPLPMMHSRISSGGYAGGTRVVRDNPNTSSHHPKSASLPPLPTAAPTTTTPTGLPGAGSGGGAVDRLPSVAAASATYEMHQQRTLSSSLVPSGGSLACSLSTTPTPPLPAAPANHHMRRARSTPSIEFPCRGDPASVVTTTDADGMGCGMHMQSPSQMVLRNTAPSAEMGSDGVNASPSTTSMSLSSTMPDLSVTPPPLPGFSTLAPLEMSGPSSRTPSSPPNASLAASPQSPMRQSIGATVTVNQTSEANKKAAVTRFRRRARSSQVFAGLSSLPFGEFSSLPTPIMINSIDRTLSQCSEVMEQQLLPHPHHHRPRPNSSAAFGTSRFVTLPTPFSSQARRGKQNSAGRSFREDSAILSRVSSFAPSAMRFGQRARRRVLSVSQAQLCLSAWDLFHRAHMGSRVQTAFQATLAASGVSSPIGLRSFSEQRNRQAPSGLRSLMSGSGSRIGVSQYQEHSSPLRSALVMSEVSSHMLSGSQWLVSTSEEGILRHDALPSAPQPTVNSRATPVSTTADYAFFCVPYEAVARDLGSEVNPGSSSSATSVYGVGPGGVGASVSVGGEMQEVEAVFDILFGIFRGGAHLHAKDQEQPPIPHNATAGAKSILVTANNSTCGNAAQSTAAIPPASSPVQDVEATRSQNGVCVGDGDTGCVSDEPRSRQDVPHPTQNIPGSQHVAGGRSPNNASHRNHGEKATGHGVVSPRIRISSQDSPTTADISFSPEQQCPAERLDKHRALSSPQLADIAGLPSASSDEWLLPLRQALVDRTIFLLVKSNQQDTLTPSRGPGSTACGREREVVERFMTFAKAHYGVTVHPWRVIVFTSSDATRARNLMLAVYAQRLQHQQKGKKRPSTSSRIVDEAPPQMVRAAGTGESHAEGETATKESVCSLPLSPLVSACIGSEALVVASPSSTKTPPDMSFLSTSRLTLESSIDGADERRAHIAAGGRWHHSEGVQRGSGDLLYTLLTQGLNVPGLSAALEEYKPLLEYQVASPVLLHSLAGGEKVAPAPPPGSRSQSHLPSGVARAVSANMESRQVLVDTARQSSGTASSLGTIERAAPMDASEIDAESSVVAAAFTHARDVVWRTSGAARVYGALGSFQHAASTQRVAKTGFLLMAWSWQLSALLPVIIEDTRSRYDQLQLNGVHARQKLQDVRHSLALHRSTSPAKSVYMLEVRLQEGFGEMTQRFLRDLRRVFLMTAASAAAPALSSAAEGSPSPRTTTASSKHESSRKQVPPLVPLDALLVYDAPSLREAYRRLAGAIDRFHAFYLSGQFDFDEQMMQRSTDTKRDVPREGKSSQPLGPLSVYEQRYAAMRDAEHLSVLQRSSPPGSPEDINGRLHPAPSTSPSSRCSVVTQPSDPATPSTTSALKPSNPRRSLPVGAAATSETPAKAGYETSVVKKGLGVQPRPQHTSPATHASHAASSPKGGPTLQRFTRHGEFAATPDGKVIKGDGDEPAHQGRLPQKLPSAAGRGPPQQDCAVPGAHSPPSGGKTSSTERFSGRSCDQLQGIRLQMERQLITYVSQINTEIINFFLATCVAAIPHLQHDCVVAELTRVKNAQLEIVSSFTKAVRGRRDAAIAVSQLYTQLDEWISNMSHLVSMVRSRPYIEKFITQLRAVLCEDVVRALAVFRGGERGSQEAEGQMRQVVGMPCSSPGAAASSSSGTSGQLIGTNQPGSENSVRTRRVGGRAATPPSTSGCPPAFASQSLAVEVGHRSARMVRYFTRLICSQNVGKTNPVSGSCTLPHSQRNGMFGEMLASPSPSRSLRSVHAGSPTSKSPHWTSRAKRDGSGSGSGSGGCCGGGRSLGLSISLSNMSAVWSREEERCRAEGAAQSHGAGTLIDNATSEEPFFAALTSSPMAAVSAEALAMLEASYSAPSLTPLRTSPVHPTSDTDPRPMTVDVDAPAPIRSNSASCIRATGARTPAVCSASGASLKPHVSGESTPTVGAALDSYVKVEGSAWHKKLAQWRAVMTEMERPSGDASGAPLLWILLDVWDETLLRMPYGLLLELDMPRYAGSLNGLSADLLDTQKSWVSLCRDSLATIERQLKALRGDITKMCHEHGDIRVEYVQELGAIFDAASRLVASSAMTPDVRASSVY